MVSLLTDAAAAGGTNVLKYELFRRYRQSCRLEPELWRCTLCVEHSTAQWYRLKKARELKQCTCSA